MENTIDTSKIITAYFAKNRTRKAALARKLNKDISHIMLIQKRSSMQTQSLWELCHALQHNFFQDIANQMPDSYTGATPIIDKKDALILQLQEEIKILKAEKEILLLTFKK
jgi:hypothetical protein